MARSTKKGDTLIEVVLSFVMFSLVAAISISVMHAGISGAEAAIELTLARVEIDTQSETLRFIQESFANDRTFSTLWHKIIENALPASTDGTNTNNKIPDLGITSCNDLYDKDFNNNVITITEANGFVVNPRRIGDGADPNDDNYYGNTLITAKDNADKFSTSLLNPRIVYTTKGNALNDAETTDETLISGEEYDIVYRAEGIYDFVIKDTTETETSKKPSHYDFHIFTCWFAPGSENPTTIGTVTRLFNPEYLNEK